MALLETSKRVTVPKPVSTTNIALNTGTTGNVDINPDFIRLAHKGANDATNHVDNASTCINVSGNKDEGQTALYLMMLQLG